MVKVQWEHVMQKMPTMLVRKINFVVTKTT